MIEISHLTKRFGPVAAVNDLSLSVEVGEVVGFLGPNGAGKSTTIRSLVGRIAPTSGTVRIGGTDVFEKPLEALAQVGYLPESNPLYREMRVVEYLRYRSKLKGVSRSERKSSIDHVMERLELLDVRRRLIGQLSKGFRQRVGLAAAILGKPKALVLDEPTSGLDPRQAIGARNLIREMGQRCAVLVSSHRLAEVERMCDRALIVFDGRIVGSGAPHELRSSIGSKVMVTTEIAVPRETDLSEAFGGMVESFTAQAVEDSDYLRLELLIPDISGDPRERVYEWALTRGWRLREPFCRLRRAIRFTVPRSGNIAACRQRPADPGVRKRGHLRFQSCPDSWMRIRGVFFDDARAGDGYAIARLDRS